MAFVYDNKEYRNLQEQVFKNMNDISFILQEEGVLNEFGIKVVGQETSAVDMPTVDDYKEDNPDWAYGDAYAIGTEAPYELYVLTRANGSHPNDYWFNIGEFPAPGPEGPEGPQGEQGVQGQTGPSGQDGITPVIIMQSPSVTTLPAGSDATATVTVGGTIAQPTYKFDFGIPRGQDGASVTSIPWGSITGSLANQTDLVSALQGKANASALASYATQVYANNVASNATYQAVQAITNSAVSFASAVSFDDAVVFNSYIYKGQSNYIDYPIELPSGSGTLALTTDIPSLTGYATEAWVSANFLSADTPIGGAAQWGSISGTLADQTDLMSKFSEYALLSDIPSLSGYATEAYVSSVLSSYATTSSLSDYATVTALSSAISGVNSTISSLDYLSVGALSSATVIPDITGLASEGYVDTQIGNLSSVYAPIGNYASQADIAALSSVYASISALSSYATVSALSDYALASVVSAMDYASVSALSADTYIPRVGGDNDGTYWTAITLGDDTYSIPQGGGSGDYVPVLVEDSEEDPEMPQYRYAGEISNSSSAIVETVTKEEPDQVAANKTTSLELYQDDAYLSHSYQEMVSKDNPDYDPEDPESSPTIEEAVDLSTNLYVGEGTITANRSSYDEGLQEVVNEEVDLFDLATKSELSSAIDTLSSVYQPIGSYVSQADLSGYATTSGFSNYFTNSNVFAGTVLFSGSGTTTFNNGASFLASIYFGSNTSTDPVIYGTNRDLNIRAKSSGKVRFSDWYSSFTLSEIALKTDIPSVSGYAELSVANTFTGENTFASDIVLSGSSTAMYLSVGSYAGAYAKGSVNGLVSIEAYLYAGGPTGGSGTKLGATTVGSNHYLTFQEKNYASEVWTFTLSDNTTVSKTILVG